MELQTIREKLFEKYIAPTEGTREKRIGIELEFSVLNQEQAPVDFNVVHAITEQFIVEFSFVVTGRDDEGHIYAAEDPKTKDIVSYDCSYNNLEFSFGCEKNIQNVDRRFQKYYAWFQAAFQEQGHRLTGMGVNPNWKTNHNVPILNERYRMLFHHLHSADQYRDLPMYFHPYESYGCFSSASQVQIDIDEKDLIKTIRAFSKLEPLKAVLFSNSILFDEREELLCCRDMMWENSTHGINPHNIGMFDQTPENLEELEQYIESTSLYCVEREGRYVNFPPIGVMDYFQQSEIQGEVFEEGSYHSITIQPEAGDLQFLRTFKFEDLTFRGTMEFRSVCCQPASDAMTVAAFHIGLIYNLDALDQLLAEDTVIYHRGFTASELRKLFVKREYPSWVDLDALYELLARCVALAEDGLKSRGFGEEKYLFPLYKRIETRENPAQRLLHLREAGTSMNEIVKLFGELE